MNSSYCNDICFIQDHTLDQYLFPALYGILIIISIPANSVAIFISYCEVKKKNELGVYLFSLSLADLLYTLTLPLWIYYAQNGDDWILPPNLCNLSAFLKYLNYYTSSGFLTCISLDRYIAIVYPMRFHYLRTRRVAFFISVFVWAFEIISNYMILIEKETFTEQNITNHSNHTLCHDKYPLEKWQAQLNFYRVGVGYVIPLAIMVFCYQKIYQAVKHNQATQDSDKRRINHLLLSIVSTFFLCFTPYHVVLLLRSISEPCNCPFARRMFIPYRITTALTSINCIADPFLYCFVSETGRSDIWNMFMCVFSASQTEIQKTQNVPESSCSEDKNVKVPETETFL
uniref:Psychosine receptor n=1 Tax=Pogona vitticeps TaxID=103695 RepID=A0A6J0VIK8_9SAUR|nr:psychosine receptor [Pogona vitticeps]